jgi:chaperonin GroES
LISARRAKPASRIDHPIIPAVFRISEEFEVMSTGTKEKKAAKSGKLSLQPLGDRVVIEREASESKTAGGIVLPDSAKDKPARGTVRAVGDGKLTKDGNRKPLQVKVGDRVLFSSYAGDEFKVEGQELLLMREDDILAVIE